MPSARSLSNLQSLLESTSEGIYGIDREGRCTFANRATSEMTGWSVDELIGKQMHELMHHHREDGAPYPHDECPIYAAFREGKGCRVTGEVFWRRDGTSFDVEYASNPVVEGDAVTGAVVTFTDVSERMRAESALRQAEEQQRLLAETIPQQVWTARPDGTLDYVNTRVTAYFGRSREQIIGEGWLDVVHPDDVQPTVEKWTTSLRTGEPYEVEFRLRRTDGTYRWNLGRALPLHDENGAITKWFGTNTDITERKLAEEERERAARRASLLAEASALLGSSLDYETTLSNVVFLVVPDVADWCIIDLLDSEGEIRGVSYAHVDQSKIDIVKEMHRRYPPRRDDPVGVASVIRSGNPEIFAAIDDDLLRAASKDEEHFELLRSLQLRSAMVVPLRTGGKVIGALTLVRESEHVLTEEDLIFAQDLATRAALSVENSRLYSAAKRANAAKDHFFAVLSHELRTPLNPVLMTVSAMETDPHLPEIVRADIAMIRRNVELEARLIDDLLDLTRISNNKLTLNRRVVDTHELLDYAVHIVRSDSSISQAPLTLELGATDFHTDADPARLQQIFWNLLKNAVKFTPPSGQVLARTSNPAPGEWLVEVIDTGRGIEPALLPVIFDAFQQEQLEDRPSPVGLGLGLAISKALADLHGARLTAASGGRDQGATFSLRVKTVAAAHATPSPESMPGSLTEKLRLLVVEDHETTAAAMVRLLTRRGHTVHLAHSVRTALEIAANHPFDLVLSDLGLPDGSGFELMAQLRNRHQLRGIAISGYGMEADQEEGRRAGFHAHLTKPVDLPRLLQALADATVGNADSRRPDAQANGAV